jgi:F0F1-type ATP synthase delta subunit
VAPKAQSVPNRVLTLPVLITSSADVGRLARELEQIDNALLQLGLRAAAGEIKMPGTSRLMDQMLQLNKLNLLLADDRVLLQAFLAAVRDKAPVLHMSFSTDPSPAFTEKLIAWLRLEIHPELLLTVGLQPTIGAGCVVRTNNKYFDFSLRQDFLKKRQLLLDKLVPAAPTATPIPAPAPEPVAS